MVVENLREARTSLNHHSENRNYGMTTDLVLRLRLTQEDRVSNLGLISEEPSPVVRHQEVLKGRQRYQPAPPMPITLQL